MHFLEENVWIPIKISLTFVLQGPINNIPALVQIMAWRQPGDKPLSGPMMVRLPTHICVTRPQWVNAKTVYRDFGYKDKWQWDCLFYNRSSLYQDGPLVCSWTENRKNTFFRNILIYGQLWLFLCNNWSVILCNPKSSNNKLFLIWRQSFYVLGSLL